MVEKTIDAAMAGCWVAVCGLELGIRHKRKNCEVLPLLNNLLENREMQLEVIAFFFLVIS